MNPVVRRSGLRMWLMAMGGIPLLVIALDVLTARRITNWLRELIFRPQDTQIYESRDVIFAWVMLAFGALFVLWGLKELFLPTKVVEARDQGLALRLNGPFRPSVVIGWESISDVSAGEADDEGTDVPLLLVDLAATDGVPDDPWGARWMSRNRLGVLAEDWGEKPADVAEAIRDFAVEARQRARTAATAAIWEEE